MFSLALFYVGERPEWFGEAFAGIGAVQEIYGNLPVRASLYYLADNRMIDYVPDPESIAAFKERVQGMIAAVCAEEFVAKPSYMWCQRCDYVDLCEMMGKD